MRTRVQKTVVRNGVHTSKRASLAGPTKNNSLQSSLGNRGVARLLRSQIIQGKSTSNLSAPTASTTVESYLNASRGGGQPLSPADRAYFEPRFGHDFSQVRIHSDARAAQSARDINARAYTAGTDIVFGSGEHYPKSEDGQKLLAHELAHVVQQRSGVNLPGGVGQQGDPYEQHADAVATRVVQGHSAEHLLDQHSGSTTGGRSVQRFAFVNEKQIEKSEKDFTATMKNWVSDSVVRNYTDVAEFKKHSSKQTDYLGNLADGTWMRFSPTGMNLLGEEHTKVVLEDVVPVVGSKNFIHEQLSADVLTAGSKVKEVYESENKELFKKLGIDKEKNKEQFGAESLFPKIGFVMTLAIPFFEGKEPITGLQKAGYVGQPVQRYLKIAWAYSKDNKKMVEKKQKAKEKIPPKTEALATVHGSVTGKLDAFITSLVVDGFIGDELVKKKNASLLAPLAEFAKACSEAMVEMAATEKSSRLSEADRKKLSGAKSTSEEDKMKLFSEWRDFLFEDNVKAAAARGVRYAGMGQLHLDHLVAVGLPKDQHPFEMAGKDITAFKALTEKLKKSAKKP